LTKSIKNAEIDHPFIAGAEPKVAVRRASMVELKNCGALISKVYTEGNKIMGILESLSGFKGPDFRDLVMVDKANIGFSLRMLGLCLPNQCGYRDKPKSFDCSCNRYYK